MFFLLSTKQVALYFFPSFYIFTAQCSIFFLFPPLNSLSSSGHSWEVDTSSYSSSCATTPPKTTNGDVADGLNALQISKQGEEAEETKRDGGGGSGGEEKKSEEKKEFTLLRIPVPLELQELMVFGLAFCVRRPATSEIAADALRQLHRVSDEEER